MSRDDASHSQKPENHTSASETGEKNDSRSKDVAENKTVDEAHKSISQLNESNASRQKDLKELKPSGISHLFGNPFREDPELQKQAERHNAEIHGKGPAGKQVPESQQHDPEKSDLKFKAGEQVTLSGYISNIEPNKDTPTTGDNTAPPPLETAEARKARLLKELENDPVVGKPISGDTDQGQHYVGVKNIQDINEKLTGAGEGLSQAFKEGIESWASDPNAVNKGIAAAVDAVKTAGAYYADKIATGDGAGFLSDIGEAGSAIKEASDHYSSLSQREQGRIIGHDFMPMFTPDAPGILQEAKALGQGSEMMAATNALAKRFENSAAMDAIKQASRDFENSDELLSHADLKSKHLEELLPPNEYKHASQSREASRSIDQMYLPGDAASTEFVDTIYRSLNTLPAEDIVAVQKAGWHIRADETIADIDKKIARQRISQNAPETNESALGLTVPADTPRSFWPGDKTRRNEIMLPEKVMTPDGEWKSQLDMNTAEYVTKHEFGHAFADVHGLETNPELSIIYRKQLRNVLEKWQDLDSRAGSLTPHEQSTLNTYERISYYLSPSGGLSETLAELYAIEHGGLYYQWQVSLANEFKPLLDSLRKENWHRNRR